MEKKETKRKEAGFFLPNRELSWVIALALVLSFLMFCSGYFWGQRRAVSQFLYKVKEESFADGITYSLYAMGPQELKETEEEIVVAPDEQTPEESPVEIPENKDIIPEAPRTVYVAPLIGFGTLHAANMFEKRVQKSGIPVTIKQRSSKTQRGRKIVWYQAVTNEYEDRSELEKIIDRVKHDEKIKEVKIIEKKKG